MTAHLRKGQFPIWKQYGVYSHWDCVSRRLFLKYRDQASNAKWIWIAMDDARQQHFETIKRLCAL